MQNVLILATVPAALQTTGLSVGVLLLLGWGAALLSRAQILRRVAATGGQVAASKDIGLTVAAIPAILAAFSLAFNNSDVIGIIALFVIFFFGLFALQILRAAALIYHADDQGITRFWFFFAKTLPWKDIDWVYPIRKTTNTYTPVGVKMSSIQDNFWAVEAGRRRRLRIATDAPGGITATTFKPILDQIMAHVSVQNIGFNQAMRVRAARKVG